MKTVFFAALTLFAILFGGCATAAPAESGRHNVVWESQSQDSTGSMPLAGGNLGLNVW